VHPSPFLSDTPIIVGTAMPGQESKFCPLRTPFDLWSSAAQRSTSDKMALSRVGYAADSLTSMRRACLFDSGAYTQISLRTQGCISLNFAILWYNLISISNHRSIYQSFNYIHDYFVSCIMH
jgi:hypothetical protein